MLMAVADILALAKACVPAVAPTTLLAVAQVESGLDPLAIGINGHAGGYVAPASRADAAARARALIAAGRSVDLGLAQINSANLASLGLSVEDAFDACRNQAAAGQLLRDGYARGAPARVGPQSALRTALSYYNTGDPERGRRNGYVAKVVRAAARGSDRSARPPPAERPAWDVFGKPQPAATFLVRPSPLNGDVP